jgi:hypothetical protein
MKSMHTNAITNAPNDYFQVWECNSIYKKIQVKFTSTVFKA